MRFLWKSFDSTSALPLRNISSFSLFQNHSYPSLRAKEILFTKASLNKFMADYCDQPVEKIAADTDRDFFMTPYEALDYGLIDEVLKTKTSHIPLPAMPSLRS